MELQESGRTLVANLNVTRRLKKKNGLLLLFLLRRRRDNFAASGSRVRRRAMQICEQRGDMLKAKVDLPAFRQVPDFSLRG